MKPNSPTPRRRSLALAGLTALLFSASPPEAPAFPPAPGFTVYGLVRDQFGWVVDQPGAEIVFRGPGDAVLARTAIRGGVLADENYRAMLPIDHNRSGELYKPTATEQATPFTIEVIISGITFLPLEIALGPVEDSKAGEFLNLDLRLGLDSDGDGLPDDWEMWQLESAGLDPLRLDLIDADGDIDGDGLSNAAEHIAGTYAFLREDTLHLEIKERGADGWNTLEFLAVIDKTYTIEVTTDLVTWAPAEFTVSEDRSDLNTTWKAPDTVMQTVQTQAPSEFRAIYRLTVR